MLHYSKLQDVSVANEQVYRKFCELAKIATKSEKSEGNRFLSRVDTIIL